MWAKITKIFRACGGLKTMFSIMESQTSPPQAENFGILTSEMMISLRKTAFPDSKIAKFSACGELSHKIFASGEIPHKKAPPFAPT